MNPTRFSLALAPATGCLVLVLSAVSTPAVAEFEIGGRIDVRLGSGKPTNDIPGAALLGRYALARPGWFVGVALDNSPEFDIEYPLDDLGLDGPDEDSVGTSTMVMAFAERRFGDSVGVQPFATLGLGINSIDVDPFTGTLDDGSAFDVRIDAGTETVLEGTVGVRYAFGPNWSVSASALLQHRLADWTIEDLDSGRIAKVGDYTVHGAYFGANYRF